MNSDRIVSVLGSTIGTVVGVVVGLLLFLIYGVLVMMWRAWWLHPAWEWYIVPLGVPQVSYWHFIALVFFFNTLTMKHDTKKEDKVQWAGVLTLSFVWPIVAWALLRWMRGV